MLLSKFITESDYKNTPKRDWKAFANPSLTGGRILIPNLFEISSLTNLFRGLLEKTHQQVKERLAEERKTKRKP